MIKEEEGQASITHLLWTGLDWTGLDWTGLDWIGLDWTGSDRIGLDERCVSQLPTYTVLNKCEDLCGFNVRKE